ncbi:MAG TPA: hypothetical protein VHC72_00100, partial [Bryobacteraceae bacterium]|nr:hypothetical protein [Bryobacteraceae bacterium]
MGVRDVQHLLRVDSNGLWCDAGGFHIDPWGAVAKALLTHAHSDHARPGSAAYLCAERGAALVRERLLPEGAGAVLETLPYGERRRIGGVTVSFHPAGHVLGSAQIRIERNGEVLVVSGDYKLEPDRTCEPFEP